MSDQPLRDRRILIVEDEWYLATELKLELAKVGAIVLGPVPSVVKALALVSAEPKIDAAVVDMNLSGEMAYLVADALAERKTPFVITTGYLDGNLDARYPGVLRCDKPVEFSKLARMLASVL